MTGRQRGESRRNVAAAYRFVAHLEMMGLLAGACHCNCWRLFAHQGSYRDVVAWTEVEVCLGADSGGLFAAGRKAGNRKHHGQRPSAHDMHTSQTHARQLHCAACVSGSILPHMRAGEAAGREMMTLGCFHSHYPLWRATGNRGKRQGERVLGN